MDVYRTEIRAHNVRWALTAKLLGKNNLKKGEDDPDMSALGNKSALCVPRGLYREFLINTSVISKVAAYSTELTAASPNNFSQSLKQIMKDYSPPPIVRGGKGYSANEETERCGKELENIVALVYPLNDGRDQATKEFAAVTILPALEAMWELLKPVATEIAQEIDEQRRAQILTDFFKKQENVAALKTAITAIDFEVRWQQERRRAQALKAALAALSELRKAVLGLQLVELKEDNCAQWADNLGDDINDNIRKSDAFPICFKKLFSHIDGKVEAFLKAAAEYDVVADKVFDGGDQKLIDALTKLSDAANGNIPAEDYFKALYETATEWAAIAEKAKKTAQSEEVKKSVDEVMIALRASL